MEDFNTYEYDDIMGMVDDDEREKAVKAVLSDTLRQWRSEANLALDDCDKDDPQIFNLMNFIEQVEGELDEREEPHF